MTEHATIAQAPPAPPRGLTARVRRRAWLEPHVRFWWLAAVVLLLAALYLLVSRYLAWHDSSRLITAGVPVPATVVEVDESVVRGKTEPGDKAVRLEYEYDGKKYEVSTAYLEGRKAEQFLIIGQPITIRVDANDPARWTPRQSPAPLGQELIGGMIALPVGILIGLLSLWLYRRTMRTWRNGQAVAGLVLSARHTALAPRAWSVRATPADEQDKRVITVFVPPDTDVARGTPIWLLLPASGGPILASRWFEP
ncbi:MAG TPA: DUF3592 domain-containing protein [Tepidisphaeraceae bacterium]|nr:DUF3592 domain-containing protein [Tepidisphaeraceae bacterium]